MNTIIRYTLMTASRDWLFIGLAAITFMIYAFSVFVGSTALSEQAQMSLSYFAGATRLVLTIGLVVFVCFHVRRLFENREVEFILSKPISRSRFVIAYWAGFALLSVISILPVIFILAFLFNPNMTGLIYWSISLVLEISLVLAFSLLASLIMKSAVASVMSSFAFYLISRLMGFFVMAVDNPKSLMGDQLFGGFLEHIMVAIAATLPRLDLFAQTKWLLYGIDGQTDLWVFQAQSIIYIGFILAMAVFDFKRKQF